MSKPGCLLNTQPGNRVLISFVKKNSIACGACIVGISKAKPFGERYDAVLDEPLNESPTSREVKLAHQYNVDINCVVSIDANAIGSLYEIYPFDLDIKSVSDCTLLLCPCGSIQNRSSMFICDHNHCHCWKHIVPWNDTLRMPNVEEVGPFCQFLSQEFPQATYITTRALLYFSNWKNALTAQDKFNIALESLQDDFALCPTCREDVRVSSIRQWLFQTPASLGASNSTRDSCGALNRTDELENLTGRPSLIAVDMFSHLPCDVDVFVTDLDRFVFVDTQSVSSGVGGEGLAGRAESSSSLCDGDDGERERWRVSASRGSMSGSVCALPLSRSLTMSVKRDSTQQQLVKTVHLSKGWSFQDVQMALMIAVFGEDSQAVQQEYLVGGACEYITYRVESEMDLASSPYGAPTAPEEITMEEDPLHWHCQILLDSASGGAHLRMSTLSHNSDDGSSSSDLNRDGHSMYGVNNDGAIVVGEIRHSHLVFSLRSPRDNVGPPCRIPVLGCPFNRSQLLKTKELSLQYRGWRQIRGDGNCYYRAAAVGFIENAIIAGCTSQNSGDMVDGVASPACIGGVATGGPQLRRRALLHLRRVLTAAGQCYTYSHEREAHDRLLRQLDRAIGGEIWLSPAEFEADIVNAYTRLDQSLIRGLRQAVSQYLRLHQNDDFNGIKLKDAILPSYLDMRSMDMYCDEWVDRMGVDAEGPLVNLGILFSPILRCSSTIVFFDRREDVELSELVHTHRASSTTCTVNGSEIGESSAKTCDNDGDCDGELGSIHILLRPGHFDLLYPRYRDTVTAYPHITSTATIMGSDNGVAKLRRAGDEVSDYPITCEASGSCRFVDKGGDGIYEGSGGEEEDEFECGIMPILEIDERDLSPENAEIHDPVVRLSGEQTYVNLSEVFVNSDHVESSAPPLDVPLMYVACMFPALTQTPHGVLILSASNAYASHGVNVMPVPPATAVFYDYWPICGQYSISDARTPNVSSTCCVGVDSRNGVCKSVSNASDYVMVVQTYSEDNVYIGGWEAVDSTETSPTPFSHTTSHATPMPVQYHHHAASKGSVFSITAVPLDSQSALHDAYWTGVHQSMGSADGGWRAVEWADEQNLVRVRDAFDLNITDNMDKCGNDTDASLLQPIVRVFSVIDANTGSTLTVPASNQTGRASVHAMAVVNGTCMCRIALRGLAYVGSFRDDVVSPPKGRHFSAKGTGDSDDSHALFEVTGYASCIGNSGDHAFSSTQRAPGDVAMGVEVCVCVDMNRYVRRDRISDIDNYSTYGEESSFCEALAASLGLDTDVYTILSDCDIPASYLATVKRSHLPPPEIYQRGIQTEVVTSGEVAVLVRIVICGRRASSPGICTDRNDTGTNESRRRNSVTIAVPLSSFSSLHLLSDFLLRSLHLHPLLAIQLCVRNSTYSDDPNRKSVDCGDDEERHLRVLDNAEQVLVWCTSRYTDRVTLDGVEQRVDSNDEPYYSLYVKYCEAAVGGTACETIYSSSTAQGAGKSEVLSCRADDIMQISRCGHMVCGVCLMRHLVLFSNDRKFMEEYESWEGCLSNDPSTLLTHIFETPISLAKMQQEAIDSGDDMEVSQAPTQGGLGILPQLRRIPCPVPRCPCHVAEDDLSVLPEYVDAYSAALVALDNRRSYRNCCLQAVMDCEPIPAPLTSMVCLGCSHFYHPACFLHMVRAVLDTAGQQRSQVDCYMCRSDARRCDCPACLNRGDRHVSGAHVINESDMEVAKGLLLEKYSTDVIARRSGHSDLAPSAVMKLMERWADVHAAVAVAAVVNTDTTTMFECKCGNVYEVERPCASTVCSSPNSRPGNSIGTEYTAVSETHPTGNEEVVRQQQPHIDDPAHIIASPRPHGAMSHHPPRNDEIRGDWMGRAPRSFRCIKPDCRAAYCAQCMTEEHPGLSCHAAAMERSLEMMRSVSLESVNLMGGWLGLRWTKEVHVNVNIQHCPNCDMAFGVPLNCHHATCEESLGGCGTEFCFICAAPREPILVHGNMFHRPSCPFNIDKFCCPQGCLRGGKLRCEELEYNEACPHCMLTGEPCDFPLNETPEGRHWKVLDRAKVEAEIKLQSSK